MEFRLFGLVVKWDNKLIVVNLIYRIVFYENMIFEELEKLFFYLEEIKVWINFNCVDKLYLL